MADKEATSDYKKDTRMPCRYGAKCYQKNPAHHEKYKHPNKRPLNTSTKDHSSKRMKAEKHQYIDSPKNDIISDDDQKDETPLPENLQDQEAKTSDNSEENESQKSEENIQKTPQTLDKSEFIKLNFKVEMPKDFYDFWNFCSKLNSEDPSNAFKDAGLSLVGPYDVLNDKFCNIPEPSPDSYFLHWRYYYDIPEFQTVIKGDDSKGFHIGYFRDDPNEMPVFMAENYAEKNGEFTCIGDNIFAAVYLYLEDLKKKLDPFKKMHVTKLQTECKNKAIELDLDLSTITSKIKNRKNKIVTRTLNKAGLIVPYDKKTEQGYRVLSISSKKFNELLQKHKTSSSEHKLKIKKDLEEVFRWATIAIDECDFGTGIQLGWDLIYSGNDNFNFVAATFLSQCYKLLKRNVFADIAEIHMKNRKKCCNLSII